MQSQAIEPLIDSPFPTSALISLDAVYREHFSYVWRTLRRLGVAPADVDDLAQEVFLVVHRRLDTYDRARPIRPWLFGVAYRVVCSYRRQWMRRVQQAVADFASYEDAGPGPEALLTDRQDRALVLQALDEIDLDQRAVLIMHDIDEMAVPEIAGVLEIPVNTAYSRLRLGREKFVRIVRGLRESQEREERP